MKPLLTRWAKPRFVCDVHLAKVAKYLRLLGFDTIWRNDIEDDEIVAMAKMGRVGLTCDKQLWARRPEKIVLLRCEAPKRQLRRIVAICDLHRFAHPLTRTLCCNRIPVACDKRVCMGEIPKESYRWLKGFWRCPKCKKIYWRGTHAKRMVKAVENILYEKSEIGENFFEVNTKVVTPRGLEPL